MSGGGWTEDADDDDTQVSSMTGRSAEDGDSGRGTCRGGGPVVARSWCGRF